MHIPHCRQVPRYSQTPASASPCLSSSRRHHNHHHGPFAPLGRNHLQSLHHIQTIMTPSQFNPIQYPTVASNHNRSRQTATRHQRHVHAISNTAHPSIYHSTTQCFSRSCNIIPRQYAIRPSPNHMQTASRDLLAPNKKGIPT